MSPAAASGMARTPTSRLLKDLTMNHHPSTWIATLAALVTTAVATLSLGVAPALADDCPNAALRAQNNSSELPDCRAYELVTNPFKQGFAPLGTPVFTDNGEFAYDTVGTFVGAGTGGTANRYLATRSATGWISTPPPVSVATSSSGPTIMPLDGSPTALSSDLQWAIWTMRRSDEATDVVDYYLAGPDGRLTRIGPTNNPATLPAEEPGTRLTVPVLADLRGASSDLSHFVFYLQPGYRYPEDVSGGVTSLYEYVGVGNARPRLVGVDNGGNQISQVSTCLGARDSSAYRAMSTDGRVIFFSPGCTEGVPEVWARVNGTTSIKASASLCDRGPADPAGACNATAPAIYHGAAADGSRVFFTTTQQLVNEDTDEGEDLYACDIPSGTPAPVGLANPCAALRMVSRSATAANVEGVTRISDDGSHVYFVASGALASNHGANGQVAVAGDDNLYVWQVDAAHPSGATTFVGKLAPGDSRLWGSEFGAASRMVQTTSDGRYLVLATVSPLIDHGPSADTDTAADVYRYDAQTGAFDRLSTDTSGRGGNDDGFDARITPDTYSTSDATARPHKAMTDDAQSVVLLTSESLSPRDTNGTDDVYEWHDGHLALISGGTRAVDIPFIPNFAWITSTGTDIYFGTTARLTAQDGDTNLDYYDARVDGGFDLTPPVQCSGDGCQGRQADPPGVTAARSDAGAPATDTAQAPALTVAAISSAERKRAATTGKLRLTITTNIAATLRAKATASIARKATSIATARRVLTAPGSASLVLSLSARAKTQLAREGKLTVKLEVDSSEVAASRSVTVKLTHAKPKSRAKARKRSATTRSAPAQNDNGRGRS